MGPEEATFIVAAYMLGVSLMIFINSFRARISLKGLKKLESPLIHLFLILFLIWTIIPVLGVIGTSLNRSPLIARNIFPSAIDVTNYIHIFTETPLLNWLKNSFIVSLGTVSLSLTLSTAAAYALSRFNFFGKKPLMLTFLLVQMFPGVLLIIPYFILLNQLGLINTYFGLILMYTVMALPLCVWMLKTFYDGIPKDLDEAALTEGCTHFKVLYKIVLPLALPGIGVVALFSFLVGWTDFMLAYLFMSPENYTVAVGLHYMVGQHTIQYHYFAAISVIMALPLVILFILFQRTLISGLVAGAVKK